jgi:very-short-patch-repair endonuclease
MKHFYNPDLNTFARQNRSNQTYSEKLVWKKLRSNKLGFKFKRQVPIGNYILDFYCSKLKLGIEIDGITHNELTWERDSRKDKYFKDLAITILRFNALDVVRDVSLVIKTIYNIIEING